METRVEASAETGPGTCLPALAGCRGALGKAVAHVFRPAPVIFHMLGPMDAQPKQRKVAQRQQKRKAPQPMGEG